MNRIFLLLLFLLSLCDVKSQNKIGFNAMVNSLISEEVDTISSEVLFKLQQKGNISILDAREHEEYEVSHLREANFVGHENFYLSRIPDHIHKSDTLIVYCSIGKRSGEVGEQLKKTGYKYVFNLYGGIFDWTNRGLEVVNDKNKPVKSVHPYSKVWGVWINNYEKKY